MTAVLRRWRESEPLRLAVWPVLVALAGALVVTGYLTQDSADMALAVLALVLGAPAVEVARRAVTSPATLGALLAGRAAEAARRAAPPVRRINDSDG